jgi:hypothetical protein
MSNPARYMTHAERAKRRANVKRSLRAGTPPPVVAAQFGVSRPYVCQIAKDAGIEVRRPGRPQTVRFDGHDLRMYIRWRRDHGAEMARAMMATLGKSA